MEKNEFLLCSEVIYRINVCRTVVELRGVLLAQLKLIIPYACASIIPTWTTINWFWTST